MSRTDPHTMGLINRGAQKLGGYGARLDQYERRGGGGSGGTSGGGGVTFADTGNIVFANVSGNVTADIPTTAEPELAKLGIGIAPTDFLDMTSSGTNRATNSVHNIATTDVVTAGYRPWRFVMNNKTTDSGSGASIGLSVANYFGGSTSSVAAHGTTHAATFDTIIMGSDSVANEQASVYMSLLDKTSDLAGSQPGTLWLTDTKVVGVLPTYAAGGATPQQTILSGHNLLINKYQAASPVLSDAVGVVISTRPVSASTIGTPQGSQTTVPVDVGLAITGVSGAFSPIGTGIGFTTAMRIGGNRTPWFPGSSPVSYGESHIGTGIEIADFDTEGIRIHRRWAGSTGKALSLGFDTAGDPSTSFRDGINFGDDVHLYRGDVTTVACDGSLTVAGDLLNANVARVSVGGLTLGMSAQTGAYPIPVTEHGVFADATSAPFTVNPPAAPAPDGQTVTVIKTDASANAVTLSRAGHTFDGAATKVLTGQYDSATMMFDGTSAWYSIGGGGAGEFPITGSELTLSRTSAGVASLTRSDSGASHFCVVAGAAGQQASVQLYDTPSDPQWAIRKETTNNLRLVDLTAGAPTSGVVMEFGSYNAGVSPVRTISCNRRLNFYSAVTPTIASNVALDLSTTMDLEVPDTYFSTLSYRMYNNITIPSTQGSNGLRYRTTGGIRGTSGSSTINCSVGFNPTTYLIAGSQVTWRSKPWMTAGDVAATVSSSSFTIAGTLAEDIAPGTITTTAGSATVTGTGTNFQDHVQPADIIRTAGGQSLTVLSIHATNQTVTLTTGTGVTAETGVAYYLPFAKDADRITGDRSGVFYGGDAMSGGGGGLWRTNQNGLGSGGSLHALSFLFDSDSSGVDGYGECLPIGAVMRAARLGGMGGSEFFTVIDANKPGRYKTLLLNMDDDNTFASYATASSGGVPVFATNSLWRHTGSKGLWINALGSGDPGTACLISSRGALGTQGASPPGGGWMIPLKVTYGWTEDTSSGTDVFCMDRFGKISVGADNTRTVRQNLYTNGFPSAIVLPGGPGLNDAFFNGISWGVDAGSCVLYRAGDDLLRTNSYLVVAGGFVALSYISVQGGTSATGFVGFAEVASQPAGQAGYARLYSIDDGASNTELRVRFGTGASVLLASQAGGSGALQVTTLGVGAATALGGADAGIFLDSTGEINSVKTSGTVFKSFGAAGDPQPRVQITAAGEYRIGPGGSSAVTITIASPAVFSSTAHPFASTNKVSFATTGALPTGLTAGTTYFVIAAGLTADAFQVSTTVGGAAVNTSGSQSGTHTVGRAVDVGIGRSAAGILNITDGTSASTFATVKAATFFIGATDGTGYVGLVEQSAAPGTPTAARTRLYVEDNAGNQALRIKFDDASVITIAEQGGGGGGGGYITAISDAGTGTGTPLDLNVSGTTLQASIPTTATARVATLGIGQAANATLLSFPASTATTGGIDFGGDTTLYRVAADTLRTADHLQVGLSCTITGAALFGSYLSLTNTTSNGYIAISELATPPAGVANRALIFCKDNATKTEAHVQLPTGSSVCVAKEGGIGAYTQTYATATHTHANPIATGVATTAPTNATPYGYTTSGQATAILTEINSLVADVANVKQVVNGIIDDFQTVNQFT